MPLVAILHTPLCPLDTASSELHYHCDLIQVEAGTEIHHRDAVVQIEQDQCSLPLFDKRGECLTMGPDAWRDHLHRLHGRVLYPGKSLNVPKSRKAEVPA